MLIVLCENVSLTEDFLMLIVLCENVSWVVDFLMLIVLRENTSWDIDCPILIDLRENVIVWSGSVLWHINHWGLSNATSSLYIYI